MQQEQYLPLNSSEHKKVPGLSAIGQYFPYLSAPFMKMLYQGQLSGNRRGIYELNGAYKTFENLHPGSSYRLVQMFLKGLGKGLTTYPTGKL
jgi:hypothetical protein